MVEWACQLTDSDLEKFHYRLSDPAKDVPLINYETSAKATKAISDYFSKALYNKPYCEIN